MLEDDEAIDYGEDELNAPVTGQDEVSLMLDEEAAPTENIVEASATKEDDAEGPVTLRQDDTTTTPLEPSLDQVAAPDAAVAIDDTDAAKPPKAQTQDVCDPETNTEVTAQAAESSDQQPIPTASDSTAIDKGATFPKEKDDRNRRDHRNTQDDLPSGWIRIKSRSGEGEVYYYNEKTGESSWTKPAHPSHSRSNRDQNPTSTSNADAPPRKKKSKKKPKRARDTERAKLAAAAAKEAHSAQHARGGRDSAPSAAQPRQQDSGRKQDAPSEGQDKKQDKGDRSEQGFSIKGAAQRQTEPTQTAKEAASKQSNNQRSNGAQQRQAESGGKRKRANHAGQSENGQGRPKDDSSKPASRNDKIGAADAKRQRTERDDRGGKDDGPRVASSWSEDAAPRDRTTGDSWRPGGDSARSASRYADSDRRDAPASSSSSSRDRPRERDADDRRRADADARDRQRDRSDGQRRDNGRDRERQEQRTASRNDAAPRSSEQDRASGSRSDSRATKNGNARATSDGKGRDHARNGNANANGNRNDRDRNGNGGQASQQRQRGGKGQPNELSSINSTHSNNKRQWGGAASSSAPQA